MKSYNHLFEKVIDYDNIDKAIMQASKHKRERPEVKRVLENKEKYITKLQELLTTQTLYFVTHKGIRINDGIQHKRRCIIQPHFVFDQIVHHCVIQAMKELLNKGMYEFSCGSVPDRGAIRGKRYIERYIRNNAANANIKYIAKMDIHHFFESVNPDLLKARFRKYIHDERMVWLLDKIIDSGNVEVDGEMRHIGLPIGYYTSQWFANWLLQDLDHFIKEQLKAKCYVRYMDDIVIFGSNKRKLHKDIESIKNFLAGYKLTLKGNYKVFKFDYINKNGKHTGCPLDFMGFKFYRNRTVLREQIMLKASRKAKKIYKTPHLNWYESTQMLSYNGWFKHTDTYKVFEKYIKPFVCIKLCKKMVRRHSLKIERRKNANKLQNSAEPHQAT